MNQGTKTLMYRIKPKIDKLRIPFDGKEVWLMYKSNDKDDLTGDKILEVNRLRAQWFEVVIQTDNYFRAG